MRTSKKIEQTFSVKLDANLLKRLKLESVNTETTIRSIVAEALDARLPGKIRIVTDDDRRASR